MKKNKFALQVFVFTLLISSFIACDKDFTTLESDILNSDVATNFDIESNTWDVITYTDPFLDEPVQTNGLGLSTLGIYDDLYGRVSSDFVTQVTLSSYEPEFSDDINDIEIDSVVLTIPFQFNVTDIDDDGNITYDIDSVIGRSPIKLQIFENNYFLRDFDPNGGLDEAQAYFSNRTASSSENITGLEGQELIIIPNPDENNEITLDLDGNIIISDQGFILTETTGEGEDVQESSINQSPGIRLKLDPQFWFDKIISRQGDAVLSNQNNFLEHFRGLYFKSEPVNNDGSFLFLNTASNNANIIIYYTRPTSTATDDNDAREQISVTINLNGNRVNFLDNDFNIAIPEGNSEIGDERLFLKGGQGSLGKIKLFNGDNSNDGDDTTFDEWKSEFVEVDEDGNFTRSKRLVNEANLVFYVDQNAVQTPSIMQDAEPNRIYLYDIDNKTPLVDYFLDGVNNVLPSFSIANHLGPLERVDEDDSESDGVKYKLKITEHINNLLIRDSTNVELGLAVSLNINLEELIPQRELQMSGNSNLTIPTSSVLTPRGTVLHGNNTEDPNKKVYLEIYYTCTEEDDCDD